MKELIRYSVVTFAIISVIAGCTVDDDDSPRLDEQKDKAKVIFINAAPDAKAAYRGRFLGIFPLYNNLEFNIQPIQFPWGNSYKAFEPGALNIKFDTARAGNGTVPGDRATVADFSLTVERDTYYSVYAIRTAQNVDYFTLTDDVTVPTNGKVKVRFLNLSADAGLIDIVNVSTNTVLASGLQYKTEYPYIEIDPADMPNVRLRDNSTGALISPANRRILLEENQVYTIWAAGIRTPVTGVSHTLQIRYLANRYNFEVQ